MAIEIIWETPRPSGHREFRFWHHEQWVRMQAAPKVQATWKGESDSAEWLKDRDAWTQVTAQVKADRMDFEVSAEGIKAAALKDYRRMKEDIDDATNERARLKTQYPDFTDVGAG